MVANGTSMVYPMVSTVVNGVLNGINCTICD